MKASTSGSSIKPRHFKWGVKDLVATITLNRPERKNPLTLESYRELTDTFIALQTIDDVRAVVITGAEGNFCSGGDVHDIIGRLVDMKRANETDRLLEFTQMTGDLVKAMRACPQPIVAAVDGICVGAGAILAMASDLRVGTERSKVAFLFVRVGLSGADMGACSILPRIIGHGRASELLFLGRTMGGIEAERWGFYNRISPPETVLQDATELASILAHGPSAAHAMTKLCLHNEWSMPIDQAVNYEARMQAECMMTNDFERAYVGFVEKKPPTFQGN
ncbi:MAG: enoyl-CoA hydratase family protein [Gemmatimonadaceae bacterium]